MRAVLMTLATLCAAGCGGSTQGAAGVPDAVSGNDGTTPCATCDAGMDAVANDAGGMDAGMDTGVPDTAALDTGIDVTLPDSGPLADASDPICQGLSMMTVTNPTWSSATIAPGDQPTLTLTLTNNSAQAFTVYPYIDITADDPRVTIPNGPQLFGILAGMSAPLMQMVTFGSTIPHGTTVHFHAVAAALHQPTCPNAGADDFSVTLQ